MKIVSGLLKAGAGFWDFSLDIRNIGEPAPCIYENYVYNLTEEHHSQKAVGAGSPIAINSTANN
ncbi:hypothetical protein [Phormidium nigroviride]